MKLNVRFLIKAGLLTSIALFYMSMVGMIELFNEREIIKDVVSFGQILVGLPTFIGGYVIGRRYAEEHDRGTAVLSGIIVGFISSLPTVLIILIGSNFNIREMFVSVTPKLLSILTFNQENATTGILILIGLLTVMGLLGTLLDLLPQRVRRAFVSAGAWTLGIGLMSELLNQILQQFREYDWIERGTIRLMLSSGVITRNFAIFIFVVAFVAYFLWPVLSTPIKTNIEKGGPATQRNVRYASYALLAVLFLALPWLVGRFLSDVLVTIGLYMVMGLGLNIAVGMAGLLDLGYLTNFAVGAYITGVLLSTGPLGIQARTGVSIFNLWLLIPISIVAAMITGFVFALPVLRMRGDYLAIATLGFGEIIGKLALSDWLKPYIGGAQGILFIPKPTFFGIELSNPEQLYYLSFAAVLFMLYVTTRLQNSRTGRQWMAIREDEDVAAAMGIDKTQAKVIAFTLSAAAGGLAGAIFATKVGTVFPNSFTIIVSINVLSLIIVGGMGSIPGVIVGAAVLIGLPELLREFAEFRFLIYGALLIVMMLTRPEGLWPSEVTRRELAVDEDNPPIAAAAD